jgi:uncharacterized protein (UPF0210 family)
MRIRTITVGMEASWPIDYGALADAARLLRTARQRFGDAGFEVQTVRIALSPFAELRPGADTGWSRDLARELEMAAQQEEITLLSIGPIRWGTLGATAARAYAEIVPDLIASTANISVAIETAADGALFGEATMLAGRAVARIAAETEMGFGNFRFCTIAECPPGIPFFPTAYHGGGPPVFSIGLEAAGVARQAFSRAGSLGALQASLAESYRTYLPTIEALASSIEAEFGTAYAGADLTPAPFPTDDLSSAAMLEDIGAGAIGAAGSLAAAAVFTRMLKALPYRQAGFSGLMLPVLEDSVLAARATEGMISWTELLLYSAVCGTGLDTVPLPGDASPEELAGIMLDVAALAVALRKPLSCRLFPVPGKRAGELTEYDFPYFANARVLDLKGRGSPRLVERLTD